MQRTHHSYLQYLFDSTFSRLFSVCSSSISLFNLPISALWSLLAVAEEDDQVDEVALSAVGEEYHELLLLPPLLLLVVVVSPHQESPLGSLDHDEVDQPELAVVVAAAVADFVVLLL